MRGVLNDSVFQTDGMRHNTDVSLAGPTVTIPAIIEFSVNLVFNIVPDEELVPVCWSRWCVVVKIMTLICLKDGFAKS